MPTGQFRNEMKPQTPFSNSNCAMVGSPRPAVNVWMNITAINTLYLYIERMVTNTYTGWAKHRFTGRESCIMFILTADIRSRKHSYQPIALRQCDFLTEYFATHCYIFCAHCTVYIFWYIVIDTRNILFNSPSVWLRYAADFVPFFFMDIFSFYNACACNMSSGETHIQIMIHNAFCIIAIKIIITDGHGHFSCVQWW